MFSGAPRVYVYFSLETLVIKCLQKPGILFYSSSDFAEIDRINFNPKMMSHSQHRLVQFEISIDVK